MIFSLLLVICIIYNNNIKIKNNEIDYIINLIHTKIDELDSNDISLINEKINNIQIDKSIIINDIYNKLIIMNTNINDINEYKEKLKNLLKLFENTTSIIEIV
jgi:hypothetical protein